MSNVRRLTPDVSCLMFDARRLMFDGFSPVGFCLSPWVFILVHWVFVLVELGHSVSQRAMQKKKQYCKKKINKT